MTAAIGAAITGGGLVTAVLIGTTNASPAVDLAAGLGAVIAVIIGTGLIALAITRVVDRREKRRQALDASVARHPGLHHPAPTFEEEIEQWVRSYEKKDGRG